MLRTTRRSLVVTALASPSRSSVESWFSQGHKRQQAKPGGDPQHAASPVRGDRERLEDRNVPRHDQWDVWTINIGQGDIHRQRLFQRDRFPLGRATDLSANDFGLKVRIELQSMHDLLQMLDVPFEFDQLLLAFERGEVQFMPLDQSGGERDRGEQGSAAEQAHPERERDEDASLRGRWRVRLQGRCSSIWHVMPSLWLTASFELRTLLAAC